VGVHGGYRSAGGQSGESPLSCKSLKRFWVHKEKSQKQRDRTAGAHKKVLVQKLFGHLSERVGKQKRIVVFTAVRFLSSFCQIC